MGAQLPRQVRVRVRVYWHARQRALHIARFYSIHSEFILLNPSSTTKPLAAAMDQQRLKKLQFNTLARAAWAVAKDGTGLWERSCPGRLGLGLGCTGRHASAAYTV